MTRSLRRNGWTIGLIVFFLVLLAVTKMIQPSFGISGLESLARAALPFALATAAMTIVVIAGGIDLSVAAVMAVASVSAARLMAGWDGGSPVVAVLFVILLGAVDGGDQWPPHRPVARPRHRRHPCHAVRLGGHRAPDPQRARRHRLSGPPRHHPRLAHPAFPATQPLTAFIPNALVVLLLVIAAIWLPLRRSRLGLSIYAIGSDQTAAFRSGVAIGPVRVAAYAIAGVLAALGGLSVAMSTGVGEPIPGPYLMVSVAAVVLGGVALTGGKGGLFGPIVAVFILRLVRLDLTLLSVDPNVTTIVEGTIMAVVVMAGGLVALRESRR